MTFGDVVKYLDDPPVVKRDTDRFVAPTVLYNIV
jgi:hypothetical protein